MNKADISGFTALMAAVCRHNHDRLTRMLIEAGADVNACTALEHTVLMFAAESNCSQCVDMLIKAGADVNKVNLDGNSALTLCTGRVEMMTQMKL